MPRKSTKRPARPAAAAKRPAAKRPAAKRPAAKRPAVKRPATSRAAAPVPAGPDVVRNGEATRSRLLEAGMTVLAARGYHAARVDDVVKAAGVSHGTFYLYFPNKEALVLALAERCAEDLTGLVGRLGDISPEPSGRAAVRSWLTEFVEIYRSYGVVIRSWVENQVGNAELTQLGLDTFARVADELTERLSASHPDDVALRVTALVSLMERFTFLVATRDLGDEAKVLDTAATVIHQGFFAGTAA
jgi:AcrR family transcriptional regulator